MKRRLTRAYDSMTMPDRCSNTIERKLTEQLESKRTGTYIKAMAPDPVRRNGWSIGLAAVCLMLVLSVGGSMLFLRTAEQAANGPREVVTTVYQTVPGDYSLVTGISGEEVEAFAAEVRQNVLEGDWQAFSQKVSYPIAIWDKTVGNDGSLVGLTLRNTVKESFLTQIRMESCNQMFCNWQGICMADGRIWINEVDGQLKITAINDMFGDLVDPADFRFAETEEGTLALAAFYGKAEAVTFPSGYNQRALTQIGTGTKVVWNGEQVKTIHIPDTVTVVREQAFADCPGLEAVFFPGDAPEEMEGVFDGSPNVVVYYKEGTKGWGDSWCGRPTMQYGEGHVSLGVATLKPTQAEANLAFLELLHGKSGFLLQEAQAPMTIERYCEEQTGALGRTVSVPCFTLVDMDRDGIRELVLWVSIEGDSLEDYLILRYQTYGNGEEMIYAYLEPRQKLTDLRKDGSFWWREAGPGQGESRLVLDPESDNGMVVSGLSAEGESPEADWHVWPCVRPELVVQSYEYAGTGQSRLPGNTYSIFEELALGSTVNDWDLLKEQLTCWGMACLEDEGTVSIFDPDAPGTCLYGVLTNENGILQLAEVGYSICTEEKECAAEIRNLLSGDPEYWVEVHLPFFMGTFGRMVSTPEELVGYFGFTRFSEEAIALRYAAKAVAEAFTMAWITGDETGMKPYLADGFQQDNRRNGTRYSPVGIPQIVAVRDLPTHGEECYVTVECRDPGQNEYVRVFLDVVKQKDGWKIKSCYYGS